MGEIIEKLRESFSKCQDGAPPENRTTHRFYINETEKEIERLLTEVKRLEASNDNGYRVAKNTERRLNDVIKRLTAEVATLLGAARELLADDRADDCQECLIGESDAWINLAELVSALTVSGKQKPDYSDGMKKLGYRSGSVADDSRQCFTMAEDIAEANGITPADQRQCPDCKNNICDAELGHLCQAAVARRQQESEK